MAYLKRHGASAGPWAEPGPGAHVRRAAFIMMYAQVEAGTMCPTTMTYAVVPSIVRDAPLAAEWLPRIYSRDYDPRFLPAAKKRGVTLGMGMTEKQGGSDVRANTTRAEPVGDREYRIVGHKWFFSAPMCDAFLILAQAPGGLSCFFLPRFTPDGEVNGIRIQRLKDKLGDKSNASSEVEFCRRAGVARRRRGPGHSDHPRDGHVLPARLRARHRGADPRRGGAGGAPCAPPQRVRPAARRSSR